MSKVIFGLTHHFAQLCSASDLKVYLVFENTNHVGHYAEGIGPTTVPVSVM